MLHDPRTIKVRTGIGGLKSDVSGHLWKADHALKSTSSQLLLVYVLFPSLGKKKH